MAVENGPHACYGYLDLLSEHCAALSAIYLLDESGQQLTLARASIDTDSLWAPQTSNPRATHRQLRPSEPGASST
jgi:hypothetical protein